MPVLAAGLADVLVRHPNPLVRGRVGHHLADQGTLVLLDEEVRLKTALHLPDPSGEPVTDPLELIDGEHAGATHPRNAEVEPHAGEGRREEPRELQLHRCDLAAKIRARSALIMLEEDGVKALRWRWRDESKLSGHVSSLGP